MKEGVFAELAISSNFSFLRGASHPEEIAVKAAKLGLYGFSICDINSLAGSVRGHIAAKEAGVAYAVGCRLVFCDGTPDILIWPKNRAAYGRLCRMLSIGRLRAPQSKDETRKTCHLTFQDCLNWMEGSAIAIVPGSEPLTKIRSTILQLQNCSQDPVRLAAPLEYGPQDARRLAALYRLTQETSARLLATNMPLYHDVNRRKLQDVITCIREHVTIKKAGRLLQQNAERHLKSPNEMTWLYEAYPDALSEGIRLFESITFSLDELRYNYPKDVIGPNRDPQKALIQLVWEGAKTRYPDGIPEKVSSSIKHELGIIERLEYAPYFLTVYDIVQYAKSQKILCQGRGSAANSVVCYCLEITEVNPDKMQLLFERFISEERKEPPDIDVDFEHERREEVIQYIYGKYGRHRAGLAATVITYRSRSAIREVGKVFGPSEDAVSTLSSTVWGWSSSSIANEDAARVGYDPNDPMIRQILDLTEELIGFPRHLSQHVGGFVITQDRLDEVIPVQNATMEDRTIVEWDKDDLDHLGILKIDVLALGMLSCLRKAFKLLEKHYGAHKDLSSFGRDNPRVYEMISNADTLGVFQIESRAQMSMLPRLRPNKFYDLVIEVAIVRPGPIQGDMVHPYLRRRQGIEKVSYPSAELEAVLERTLGVPLFQEQAMQIAIVGAGFTPGEADRLRRAMATFRRVGTIGTFKKKMIDGMVAKGYEAEFAERCFKQIEGFGEYGFPESHAASFALLVYASCWLKCFYPDVFCTALLNAQPMGFYSPGQIIRDTREHGVEVREIDINYSTWDHLLEETNHRARDHLHPKHREMVRDIRSKHAVRLGLRLIKGIGEDDANLITDHRSQPYQSIRELWLKTGLAQNKIERLADADAFRSMGLDRRRALWEARNLEKPLKTKQKEASNDLTQIAALPLFDQVDQETFQQEPVVDLPEMPLGEHVINDYRYLSLSLKAHPVSFVRSILQKAYVIPTEALEQTANGRRISVAGLVLVRQRPGSAKGVIFITLEDETGIANAIIWPKTFQKYRPILMAARFLKITGRVQKADNVIHVVADHVEDWTPHLAALSEEIEKVDIVAHADEVKRPVDNSKFKQPRIDKRQRKNDKDETLVESYLEARLEGLMLTNDGMKNVSAETRKVLPKGRNFH